VFWQKKRKFQKTKRLFFSIFYSNINFASCNNTDDGDDGDDDDDNSFLNSITSIATNTCETKDLNLPSANG